MNRLSTTLFAIGAGLAGLAGAVVAPLQAVTSGMDASILVAAFIVAILGGLGSIGGAALGAVIIGEFQAFGVLLLPQWSSTFIYVVMVPGAGVSSRRPVGSRGMRLGRVPAVLRRPGGGACIGAGAARHAE